MNFDDYLGLKQANALYRNMRALVISSVFVNVLLLLVMWPQFNKVTLLIWFAVSTLVALIRWWSTKSFTSESTNQNNYRRRLRMHTLWSTLNGVTWGAAALLFQDPSAPIYSVFLICALTGYISVTILSNTLYLPQFYGFVFSATLAFILSYLILGSSFYAVLCGYAILYSSVMLVFGRIANRNYIDSKRLEFENSELLLKVTQEKQLVDKANADKNQFLAATSHDLRQPLHAMGLYIDALEPRMQDSTDAEIVSKLKQSGQALNDLLYGLLDISRLDAGVLSNKPLHISLADTVERLLEEVEPQLLESRLELRVEVSDQHYVYADPVLLTRVARNLLSNAIKYTEKGTIKISSARTAGSSDRNSGSKTELAIEDTGVGVPEDKIDSIFSEFTQLQNPERDRNKGLGLGLSIVRRLCELQNIDYRFHSQEGKGSCVTLSLANGDKALAPLKVKSKNSIVTNRAILVVDDEQAIRDAMSMMIQSWQCIALIASSQLEALTLIHEHNDSIDLIISDLRLRENENGVEVIGAIREELNHEVPAIVLTGDTAVERIELAQAANVVLMHKPIEAEALREQIALLIAPQ